MGADVVQLFVQSPRTWRFPEHDPADLEAFRSKREEAGIPALVHALYLVNLAAPDDAIYSKSVDTMRSTMDAACAIEADAVIFHLGSHLGAGFETGLERVVPGARTGARPLQRANVAAGRELRRRRRDDRPLDRRARRGRRRTRTATSASASASTPVISSSRASTSPTRP